MFLEPPCCRYLEDLETTLRGVQDTKGPEKLLWSKNKADDAIPKCIDCVRRGIDTLKVWSSMPLILT